MHGNRIGNLIIGYVLVFGGGFVVACNLFSLISINPFYEASWFKVGIAILLSLFGTYTIHKPNFDSDNADDQESVEGQ